MSRFWLSIVLLFAVLVSHNLSAQVSQSTPQGFPGRPFVPGVTRDPQALVVVQAAINALGGATVIGQIQSWTIQGQMQGSDGNNNQSGTVIWQKAGPEFRMESDTDTGAHYVVTGHGKPGSGVGTMTKSLPAHMIRAMFVPPLVGANLLAELQDQNWSIQSGGTALLGSEQTTVINTSSQTNRTDALVTPQTWYFDSSSGLPVRVEYRLPGVTGPKLFLTAATNFAAYQAVVGALYPFQLTNFRQGNQSNVVTLTSISPNASVASSQFDAPGGVQ